MPKGEQVATNKITPDLTEWTEWLEICTYTGWTPEGPLIPIKYHKYVMPFNPRLHVGVQFYDELMGMINSIQAIRMAIVGPPGTGKTYMALHIANILESGNFTIDQVILSAIDYLRLVDTLGPKRCIILDEPTYFASARTWQDQYQQLLVRTLESSRFKNNPVLLPVVNRNLLDKVIREYYLNFVIEMSSRGIGRVYRTHKDQWNDNLYRNRGSLISAYYPGVELARCGRDTCLYCPQLPTCNKYIWPQYERKREAAVDFYRKQDQRELGESQRKNNETFKEICDRAWTIKNKLVDDKGEFSIPKIRYELNLNIRDGQMVAKYLTQRVTGVSLVTA